MRGRCGHAPSTTGVELSYANELREVARTMVSGGRGLLAADESSPTLTKRFDALGLESTADTRLAWREMLFTTPGLSDWISGVILYDETFRQRLSNGSTVPEFLAANGMLPGIKVDTGAKPMAGRPAETVTEGLDGLAGRLAEYRSLGGTFAKWRAVIKIEENALPSRPCILANAHALARYARICQSEGIVPIVEPEVLMDGNHSLERSFEVTAATLNAVFAELWNQEVAFDQMVLKPSMVISGKGAAERAGRKEVAAASVECYRNTVPAAVAGIALLSGGQNDHEATEHLALMNELGPLPWPITFSYGRALQDAAMNSWASKRNDVPAAQAALADRAGANFAAAAGRA